MSEHTQRHVVRDPDTGDVLAATCTDGPMSDETRAAFVGLAQAVQRRWESLPAAERAELEARQAAALERIRERRERLGGTP